MHPIFALPFIFIISLFSAYGNTIDQQQAWQKTANKNVKSLIKSHGIKLNLANKLIIHSSLAISWLTLASLAQLRLTPYQSLPISGNFAKKCFQQSKNNFQQGIRHWSFHLMGAFIPCAILAAQQYYQDHKRLKKYTNAILLDNFDEDGTLGQLCSPEEFTVRYQTALNHNLFSQQVASNFLAEKIIFYSQQRQVLINNLKNLEALARAGNTKVIRGIKNCQAQIQHLEQGPISDLTYRRAIVEGLI